MLSRVSELFKPLAVKASAFLGADLTKTAQHYLDASRPMKAFMTLGPVGAAFLGFSLLTSSFWVIPEVSLIFAVGAIRKRASQINPSVNPPKGCGCGNSCAN